MSVHTTSEPTARHLAGGDRGYGWVMLAGVLLVAAGCMSFTEGFAAVNDSRAS